MSSLSGRTRGIFLGTAFSAVLAGGAVLSASHTEPGRPHRAIVVSFDAAAGVELSRRLTDGTLGPDGFAWAARNGLHAERLVTVTPSLTGVVHASLSTGAPPAKTGIVGNVFHPRGAPLSARLSAYEAEPDIETLWEAARRQGRRVASMTWPSVSQMGPRTTTAVGLRWSDPITRSILWNGPTEETPIVDAVMSLPLQAESYSPPKTFSLKPVARRGTETFAPVRFVLLDTTNDGRRNYDRVAILNDRGGLAASARAGEWFSLAETPGERDGEKDVLAGRWGKVLALTPDLSAVSVYLGGLHVTRANPEDFRKTLDRRAGFWPGSPDPVLLAGKRPDNRTFLEQAERFTDFLITAFEVARRRGDWDLLLAYQPLLDQGGHAFSWTDPRHPGYTEDLAARGSLAMQRLWRAADRAAAAYLRFARDGDGDVFLVSDHGIRPVYRSVRIHELLQRGGFLQPNGTGVTAHVNAQATQHAQAPPAGKPAHDASASPRVAAVAGVATADPASTMDAFARGGAACILVNRAGVYPGGNVEKESADPLVEAMARYLRDLRDDAGDRVFTTVATRAELPALRLDHENAGDLFLIAAPGTSIRTGFAPPGDSSIFAEPENPGEHGYEPDPKLDALFLHVGEGIARESVPTIAVTDVARLVSLRLGIDPPSGNAPAAREATAAP